MTNVTESTTDSTKMSTDSPTEDNITPVESTETENSTPAETESTTKTTTKKKAIKSAEASLTSTATTIAASTTKTTTAPSTTTSTRRASKESSTKGNKGSVKDSTKMRLLVSNIPYDLKWQDLKDLFKEKVGSEVCFVEIYEGADGKSIGTGVIEVKGKDLADRTTQLLHKTTLKNRTLIVREEKEKDRQTYQRYGLYADQQQQQQHICLDNKHLNNTNNVCNNNFLTSLGVDIDNLSNQIFVANLDYSVTVKKLKEVFLMAGTVLQVELKMDKAGASRGLATVYYENVVEAIQAIAMFNGQYLLERPMNVRMDRLGEAMHQHVPCVLPSGLKGVGPGLGPTGQPLLNIGHVANVLVLNNIMNVSSAGKLMNVFLNNSLNKSSLFNTQPQQQQISPNNNNRCTSTGAIPQNSYNNYNNNLYSNNNNNMYSNANPYNNFNNYNLAQINGFRVSLNNSNNYMPSMLRSTTTTPHFTPPSKHDNTTVIVKNLPYSVTWQVLKDKFKEAGEIEYAEVKMDGGRSKGSGTVRFQGVEGAKKAIVLFNGYKMEGRNIEVKTHF